MTPYGKTYNVFKRSADGKTAALGQFGRPEFEYLAGLDWVFYEKVDGTNIRILISPAGAVEVRGRSDKANLPPGLESAIRARLPSTEELVESQLVDLCVYGEGYGAGIQSGGNYRQDKAFVGFDVRHGTGIWYRQEAVKAVCDALNLDFVPARGMGPLLAGVRVVTQGLESWWGDFYAEGLVARPAVDLFDQHGAPVKCKIKHRDLFTEKAAR